MGLRYVGEFPRKLIRVFSEREQSYEATTPGCHGFSLVFLWRCSYDISSWFPFFAVRLARPGARGETGDYWIGKDLSRAMDEVDFYENVKRLQQAADAPGYVCHG